MTVKKKKRKNKRGGTSPQLRHPLCQARGDRVSLNVAQQAAVSRRPSIRTMRADEHASTDPRQRRRGEGDGGGGAGGGRALE